MLSLPLFQGAAATEQKILVDCVKVAGGGCCAYSHFLADTPSGALLGAGMTGSPANLIVYFFESAPLSSSANFVVTGLPVPMAGGQFARASNLIIASSRMVQANIMGCSAAVGVTCDRAIKG